MNEQDSKILTEIQRTLAIDPNATQRTMAENSNISLGMMNAVLKRCIERGWIAVQNLSVKKVCYCLTPEGFNEISRRTTNYMKRSFSMMNDYADKIQNMVNRAKSEGKNKVVLFGKSNVQFVIEWACEKSGMVFEFFGEKPNVDTTKSTSMEDSSVFYIFGECVSEQNENEFRKYGCKSICDVIKW